MFGVGVDLHGGAGQHALGQVGQSVVHAEDLTGFVASLEHGSQRPAEQEAHGAATGQDGIGSGAEGVGIGGGPFGSSFKTAAHVDQVLLELQSHAGFGRIEGHVAFSVRPLHAGSSIEQHVITPGRDGVEAHHFVSVASLGSFQNAFHGGGEFFVAGSLQDGGVVQHVSRVTGTGHSVDFAFQAHNAAGQPGIGEEVFHVEFGIVLDVLGQFEHAALLADGHGILPQQVDDVGAALVGHGGDHAVMRLGQDEVDLDVFVFGVPLFGQSHKAGTDSGGILRFSFAGPHGDGDGFFGQSGHHGGDHDQAQNQSEQLFHGYRPPSDMWFNWFNFSIFSHVRQCAILRILCTICDKCCQVCDNMVQISTCCGVKF